MPRFINPHNFLLKMIFWVSLAKPDETSKQPKAPKLYKFDT